MWNVSGHEEAAKRLLDAWGSIYAAFDSLGIFTHEDAVAYLEGSPGFTSLPEDQRGKVVGLCMGFALTAVEADRRMPRGAGQRKTASEDEPA